MVSEMLNIKYKFTCKISFDAQVRKS